MKSKLIALLLAVFSCLALAGTAFGQETVTVRGKVVDQSGQPVIGAGIVVKGTTTGTTSFDDGTYSLDVASDAVLEVSCIGYKSQEISVNGRTSIDVVLEEDAEMLEATVVVAYGEVRASNFTGAVQKVGVANTPQSRMGFTNPTEILRGKVPGMQISQTGRVGQTGSMLVRGRRSLGSSSSEPLLVVDGLIYKGSMMNLDPNNIESIQVLKDASSLAAYGSQAAQGVIMITTRKGTTGKPTIEFSTTQSFNTPTYKKKYFDAEGYIALRNARIGNYDDPTNTSVLSDIELKNLNAGKEYDWFDLSTRTGWTQNYNARVSGGSELFNYSMSIGRSMMEGVQKGNNYNRTNLNAKLNSKINDYIEVGLTMDYSGLSSKGGSASLDAQRTSPLGSPYFDNTGKMRKYPTGADGTSENPLWNSDSENGFDRRVKAVRTTYNGFLTLRAPWIDGLSYKFNVSYGRNDYERDRFYHESYYPSMGSGNNEDGYTVFDLSQANGDILDRKNYSWVIDNIITYSHNFDKHSVNVSLVYTRDSERQEGHSMSASNFSDFGNTLLGWYGLNQANTRTIDAGTYTLHNDVGYLARVMYSYDNRYNINLSYRRDGSSVFGEDKKWGNFPAVGLAWTISNEQFMKKYTFIDNLKLKFSWGRNGSQTLDPYGTLSQLTLGRTDYGIEQVADNVSSILYSQYVSVLGNPDLGWQETESYNAGFETALFDSRITADVDYYFSKTTDQIFSRTIPIMGSGVSTQQATMGQVNNWGIEATINTLNIQRRDFSWSSDFTFNLNRNKLKKLWGGENEEDDLTNEFFIGKSLDEIWFYQSDGVVQEDGTGSLPTTLAGWGNVIDQDGNGNLDNNDKVFLGNTKENFRITWGNTFTYKDLSLYFLLTGTFGGNGYCKANNTFAYYTHYGFAYANAMEMPYWTPTNHSNTYVSPQDNGQEKTWRVYNSYANVRLQDLSLSWDFSRYVKGWGIQGARVYVSGQNLFYIAPKWKRGDPEAREDSDNGISARSALLMKTYTVGLTFTL